MFEYNKNPIYYIHSIYIFDTSSLDIRIVLPPFSQMLSRNTQLYGNK